MQCRAGGEDIIDEEDAFSCEVLRPADGKCFQEISQPCLSR